MTPGDQHLFERAIASFRAGALKEAERGLTEFLRRHPRHFAALNLFGALLAQLARFREAEAVLRRAIAVNGGSDATFYNYGLVLKALGRPLEALATFDKAIALNPTAAETWNNRGTVNNDLRRYRDAVEDFRRAVALNPGYAEAFYNMARALAELKDFDRSVAAYDAALRIRPDWPEALTNRGLALHQQKRFAEALASHERALTLRPADAQVLNNRGNALKELKRFEEALASYQRALSLQPDFVAVLVNRGNVLNELKRFEQALESYQQALAIDPEAVDAQLGLGSVFFELNRHDEAMASYDRALAIKPDRTEAWLGRGNVLLTSGEREEALANYKQALAINPEAANAWLGCGNVLSDLGRYDEAMASYDRALAIEPDLAEAWLGRGNVLNMFGQREEALASYDRALSLKSDLKYLAGHRLHAKMLLCDWRDFAQECAELIAAVSAGRPAAAPFSLLAVSFAAGDQLKCARIFVGDQKFSAERLWRGERYAHDRIRVAYLSADYRVHPVAHLLAGIIERHDRGRVEPIAISFGPDDKSAMRERLKDAFERFIDVRDKSDAKAARLMRELEVDIAVDLMGYTTYSRPGILARRPAPIQVNYLGYAGTLGAEHIDYIIADRCVIPEDQRQYYSEQVAYLPDSFMGNDATRRISERTPSRAEAGLPEAGFVFCCFNNAYKINPYIFDIWMRLLRAVEGSVLWLSGMNASTMANLRREAEARGVRAERLIFAARVERNEDHLARQRLADLFLDTLPYNAHATASDALWAGLPVLTRLGETFAGRVAASLLRAVGLPELITHSAEEYEALALKLAREPLLLAEIRTKLARNYKTHALFDTPRFVRHLEAAYAVMWQIHQRGAPPRSFSVEPTSP